MTDQQTEQKPDDSTASNSTPLLPCPVCKCTDLEGGAFRTDRNGNWEINCGHPDCEMYLQSSNRELLISAWNLLAR